MRKTLLPVGDDSGRLVPPEGFVMTQSQPRTLSAGDGSKSLGFRI